MLHLAGTEYTLRDKAFDIFISGCTRKCKGCYNTELWSFDYGAPINKRVIIQLAEKVKENKDMIETIRILGGDLLCSDSRTALKFIDSLYSMLADNENLSWVLFTGATEKELPCWAYEYFDVIKIGKYNEDLHDDNYYLASTNQRYLLKGMDY